MILLMLSTGGVLFFGFPNYIYILFLYFFQFKGIQEIGDEVVNQSDQLEWSVKNRLVTLHMPPNTIS